jgi:hypothetical protein
VPHPPQCLGSLLTSMHEEPHRTSPSWQVTAHLPSTHAPAPPDRGDGHRLSHAPQCATSRLTSAQPPAQGVNPPLQEEAHTPATHAAVPFIGAGQTSPHAPQLMSSACRSTHTSSQSVRPSAQPEAPGTPRSTRHPMCESSATTRTPSSSPTRGAPKTRSPDGMPVAIVAFVVRSAAGPVCDFECLDYTLEMIRCTRSRDAAGAGPYRGPCFLALLPEIGRPRSSRA